MTGITLGGQQVGPHGAFATTKSALVHVHRGIATGTVPAGSAALIQFS